MEIDVYILFHYCVHLLEFYILFFFYMDYVLFNYKKRSDNATSATIHSQLVDFICNNIFLLYLINKNKNLYKFKIIVILLKNIILPKFYQFPHKNSFNFKHRIFYVLFIFLVFLKLQ